jgi:hypothetical protein
MVPWLNVGKDENLFQSTDFDKFFTINLVALGFIAAYGVLGLCISRYSVGEVRNGIFRFLNSDFRLWLKVIFEGEREEQVLAFFHMKNKDTRRTLWKKCKYVFAKAMAMSFSLTAAATAIICQAVFISTVVTNEILLQFYPVSEHSDAIEAWGTWVGAGLVLIAIVINRYGDLWLRALKMVLFWIWSFIAYSKEDRAELRKHTKGKATIKDRLQLLGRVLWSPFVHIFWSFCRGFWTCKTTIHFFIVWWKDTENVSQQRGKEIAAAWKAEATKVSGGKPACGCYVCTNDEGKRLRREKEDAENKRAAQVQYNSPSGAASVVLSGSAIPLQTLEVNVDVDEFLSRVQSQTGGERNPLLSPDIRFLTSRTTFVRQGSSDSIHRCYSSAIDDLC